MQQKKRIIGIDTRDLKIAKTGAHTYLSELCKTIQNNQAQLKFVLERAKEQATSLFPIGALTKNSEGHDLAELFDMKNAGAVAFSEGSKSIADDGFVIRALQYCLGFGGLLMLYPENKSIAGKAQVNESANSSEKEKNILIIFYLN